MSHQLDLLKAAREDDEALARQALAGGACADKDVEGEDELTLLHEAVLSRSPRVAALLAANGAPAARLHPQAGSPAICLAVERLSGSARVKMLRALASAGADVDERDAMGQTALMRACASRQNSADAVAELLSLGADPSAKETGAMAKRGAAPAALAAANGNAEALDLIIKAGGDALSQDGGGNAPAHGAALAASEPCMRVLIAAKAMSWGVKNSLGKTPLNILEDLAALPFLPGAGKAAAQSALAFAQAAAKAP